MRILLLGGTIFLGRHFADAALAAGHALTLFHRGRHTWDGPDAVTRVTGDRNVPADLDALAAAGAEHGGWDAVIDTSAYVPRHVRDAGRALAPLVRHYQVVTSISVYADTFADGGEAAPLAKLPPGADPATETVTGETYGPLKAACEVAAQDAFAARGVCVSAVRPGLIVGPRDPTDRWTWWVRRLARPGPIVAPGDGSRRVQFVDGRDLAAFMLRVVEAAGGRPLGPAGDLAACAFNVTGAAVRFDAFLAAVARGIAEATGAPCVPDLRWIPEDVLLARGAAPWSEVPVWSGPEDHRTEFSRARAAGLTLRDVAATARDTFLWDRTRDPAAPLRAGTTPARERILLG